MAHAKVDLRDHPAFTLALLDDVWQWRHRVVETIDVGLADHVSVSTRYQLEFPPDLVGDFAGADAVAARVFLPVTARPKQVLLGFSARGPQGAPAHLLLRSAIADLVAHHVTGYVLAIHDQDVQSALAYDLLSAISVASPATYDHFVAEAQGDRVAGIRAYVQEGIGVLLSADDLYALLRDLQPVSLALAATLGESPDDRSAAENVLLALPYLPQDSRPTTTIAVRELVEQYARAILGGRVDHWLAGLIAEYGRRWPVILEMDAPLHEPFTVHLIEERPVVVQRTGILRHAVALDDARSYHLQARVTDPSIRIAPRKERRWVRWQEAPGPVLRDPSGEIVGIPNLEGGRDTAELFAVYSSEPDRPSQAVAELRLQPVESVALTATVVETLAWFAALASALISAPDPVLQGKLGILTIPTTFAVALLLVREQSPVAARLMRWRKRRTLAAFLVLWSVALVRLV